MRCEEVDGKKVKSVKLSYKSMARCDDVLLLNMGDFELFSFVSGALDFQRRQMLPKKADGGFTSIGALTSVVSGCVRSDAAFEWTLCDPESRVRHPD